MSKQSKTKDQPVEDHLIFICACHSIEHQAMFYWDADDEYMYVSIHLCTWDNFFERLWTGIKYAFGYTSIYGQWDSFIFKPEDLIKLEEYIKKSKKVLTLQK